MRISFFLKPAVLSLWVTLAAANSSPARPGIVLNEVMYHPAHREDMLQYVELFNTAKEPVDLTGWKLKGGLNFTLPPSTTIPPGGYLVVCRDLKTFQARYGTNIPVLGNFSGRLKHSGEKIELADNSGAVVESMKFSDRAPWPAGPDGFGASLERISPAAAANEPKNWAPSKRVRGRQPAGTPGRENDSYSAQPLPIIAQVKFPAIPAPGTPIPVSFETADPDMLERAKVHYTAFDAHRVANTGEVAFKRVSGSSPARFEGTIPPMQAGTLIRFSIEAASHGAVRIEPSPNEPRPAFSSYVSAPPHPRSIPIFSLINLDPPQGRGGRKFGPPATNAQKPGNSTVLFIPLQGEPQLFDFVQARRRSGGWKVHFFDDQPLEGMTALNLLFEGPPRWVLSEHLSYELYRKCGMSIQRSGHYRLAVDGRELGYHLFVEQPNRNFLKRSGRNEDGNLYKILWYGDGVAGQHEKKTNPETGHKDVLAAVDSLNHKSGAAQWAWITNNFDVDAFANYYAVNMCIENWDGFFNNHFVFHDLRPGGKWDIIPWDEDKTWGEYDGGPQNYDWFDMPLTMGMKGDSPSRGWFGGGPFGGQGWWRPPGWFSGPLLANPQFRKKFEARLREICAGVFTEEHFGPVVDELQRRLRPEVEAKAKAQGEDPRAAVRRFDAHIASFHRQLANRRKYILAQLGN